MTIKEVVTQTQVAIYVQPDGPFSPMVVYEEGQTGIGDITRPGPGARTLNFRADVFGNPVALNATRAAPGQPAFNVESYLGAVRDLMEKNMEQGDCYAIQVRVHECESVDHPAGWKKVYHFGDTITGDQTVSAPNAIPFSDGNVQTTNPQQPIYEFMIVRQSVSALTTSEINAITGVDFINKLKGCKGCPEAYAGPDQIGYFTCEAVGAGTANVLYTKDGGGTIATTSADPAAADEHIAFPQVFSLNPTQWRLIVGRTVTDAGNAAEYYYASPTKGIEETTVWTAVEAGSTNGDVITAIKRILFSRIYIGFGAGKVALSTDQGESNSLIFTESGGNPINAFAVNPRNGNVYAVGDGGAIAVEKGFSGTFEELVGPTGVPDLRTISIANDSTLWVGGDTVLYRSTTPFPTSVNHWVSEKDFGTNNNVLSVDVKGGSRALGGDPQILHVMTSQAATLGQIHITLDGASFVEGLTVLTNTGYNAVYWSPVDLNKAFIVGNASATPLGTIHKLSPEAGV